MNYRRHILIFIFTISLLQNNNAAFAQQQILLNDIKQPQQASEYIFRSSLNESLISVQLLGAVNKPGIYYIPTKTDLLKLLTLAGGSSSNADVSELIVRKIRTEDWLDLNHHAVAKKDDAYLVNAEKILKQGGAVQLTLSQDDFIYVPQKSGLLSQEAVRDVTFLSVVTGIVLSGLLIHRYAELK